MRHRLLDATEIRILGALLEKEQTTPEYYPQTVNQVIAACNQRSNREPVTDYDEDAVESALDRLRADVLTWRSDGARSPRWAHCLDRRWQLAPGTKAVMTLLLLRGPQTPGELRTRSERLHAFASVEEVETALASLASGPEPLVQELQRRPGQRENRWRHLVGEVVAGDGAHDDSADSVDAGTEPGPALRREPVARVRPAAIDPATIFDRLDALERQVGALQDELLALRQRLGET
jgi:uncharacterized protein YceH (UPF0502 family)